MAKFGALSEEMVTQILLRLPPNSLMRFKCIRKSWYNLINSPNFVAKNISSSTHNKFASATSIVIKRVILKDNNIKDKKEISDILGDVNNDKKDILLSLLDLYNDNDGDDHNLHSVVQDVNVPHPIDKCAFGLEIAGHCNGIICLKNNCDGTVVLCNPAIKQFIFLPDSSILFRPPDRDDDGDDGSDDEDDDDDDAIDARTNAVGFGYDSRAKEYKVVRTVRFYKYGFHYPSKAEVYTLGANSWREIQASIESSACWCPSSHIYFNRIYYWLALSGEKQVILSFDMSNELFHDIMVPDSFHEKIGYYRSLSVWKESVTLLSHEEDSPKCLDVWILDYYGCGKGSWTKHLAIGPLNDIVAPLVFWNSDELLMVTNDGYVVSYNLSNQTLKYLSIYSVEDPKYTQAVLYVNSIVSVHGGNNLEIKENSS